MAEFSNNQSQEYYYNGYVETHPSDDFEDDENLAEIEKAMMQNDTYDEADDTISPRFKADANNMSQFEAEILEEERRLISGATSVNERNILQQTWFPDSRNCDCCKGFKYACSCLSSTSEFCSKCIEGVVSNETKVEETIEQPKVEPPKEVKSGSKPLVVGGKPIVALPKSTASSNPYKSNYIVEENDNGHNQGR
eukprot:gene22749-29456_t